MHDISNIYEFFICRYINLISYLNIKQEIIQNYVHPIYIYIINDSSFINFNLLRFNYIIHLILIKI